MNGPGVLLTVADHYGTLAAARSLGRAGVHVVVADARRLAPARWSRHVRRTMTCPDVGAAPERFLEWLFDLGAREPGLVLYPTSDDVAWLLARHRAALGGYYRLYVPRFEAVYALLNKWRLYRACVELGVDAPETWLPRSDEEVAAAQRDARLPLVIKPQTQAFLAPHQKGRIARTKEALLELRRDICAATRYAPIVLAEDPGASSPLLQWFVESETSGIYNLSGFIDETGEHSAIQASRKVLQWPRRLGVGLCFEDAAVEPALADDVVRLCRHVGYYGAFEVEFLDSGERRMLIDFNPRFYGQMEFDVARGLNLPLLVYLAASGQREELLREVARARVAASRREGRVYRNRIEMNMDFGLLGLAERLGEAEQRRWLHWHGDHHTHVSDAVLDRRDWMPGAVAAAAAFVRRALHPRSTLRSVHE